MGKFIFPVHGDPNGGTALHLFVTPFHRTRLSMRKLHTCTLRVAFSTADTQLIRSPASGDYSHLFSGGPPCSPFSCTPAMRAAEKCPRSLASLQAISNGPAASFNPLASITRRLLGLCCTWPHDLHVLKSVGNCSYKQFLLAGCTGIEECPGWVGPTTRLPSFDFQGPSGPLYSFIRA